MIDIFCIQEYKLYRDKLFKLKISLCLRARFFRQEINVAYNHLANKASIIVREVFLENEPITWL